MTLLMEYKKQLHHINDPLSGINFLSFLGFLISYTLLIKVTITFLRTHIKSEENLSNQLNSLQCLMKYFSKKMVINKKFSQKR